MLPVNKPQELRRVQWIANRNGFQNSYDGNMNKNAAGEIVAWSVSYPVYTYLRDRVSGFSGLAAFTGSGSQLNLTLQGHASLAKGQLVSGNYFNVLGSTPLLGRTLQLEDDRRDAPAVAVLGYGYWERALGRAPRILGQKIAINGTPAVIVGILGKAQCGIHSCPDVVLPMAMYSVATASPDVFEKPTHWYFELIGRLKPGVAEETTPAETELAMRQAILAYRPAREYDPPRIELIVGGQGFQNLRSDLSSPLQILGWAMAAVLLVACANIAGLLLARATSRQREIGTRLAIGAGRGRLMRQLLTESLLLAVAGGAIGIGIAYLVGDSIVRLFLSEELPSGLGPALNPKALAFSVTLCVLTGIAFGLAPALRATHTNVIGMLKASGPTQDRSRFRTGKILIALQVAFSLALVAVSALLLRTLLNLRSAPLGFRPENLLVFQLNPRLNGYGDQRLLNFHEEVLKRLERIPGVRTASMSRWGLLSGAATSDAIAMPGRSQVSTRIHYVAPRFLETLGVPLLAGRDISWADRETSPFVVVINEELAKRLFPNQNAIGQTIPLNGKPLEVIGLAGDARYDSLRRAIPPTMYIPFRQHEQVSMTYVIRSEIEPRALVAAARQVVESVDPNVPLYEIRTQAERIDENLRRERVTAYLLSAFALLALTLAGLGVYGTLAFLVAQRTPEIGIRLALGATQSDVVGLVLRESMIPVLAGVAAGVAGALVAGKLVEILLFGLTSKDPATLGIAAGLLMVSAFLAGLWPAQRASRIAPMQALRVE